MRFLPAKTLFPPTWLVPPAVTLPFPPHQHQRGVACVTTLCLPVCVCVHENVYRHWLFFSFSGPVDATETLPIPKTPLAGSRRAPFMYI